MLHTMKYEKVLVSINFDRAVFNWVSLNQNQSNRTSQLQGPQTIQWTNQNSK